MTSTAPTSTPASIPDPAQTQPRILRVLVASQILSGAGLAAGVTVGRISQARGRRPGLATGYLTGAIGSAGVITAAVLDTPVLGRSSGRFSRPHVASGPGANTCHNICHVHISHV